MTIVTLTSTDARGTSGARLPRILIVDDEPLVLQTLSRTLRRNYEIVTAASGPEAVIEIQRSDWCAAAQGRAGPRLARGQRTVDRRHCGHDAWARRRLRPERSRGALYDAQHRRDLDDLREVQLCDVQVGMIFAFDVVAESGLILVGRGQAATPSLVRRIQNHWRDIVLREPARVIARGAPGRGSAPRR